MASQLPLGSPVGASLVAKIAPRARFSFPLYPQGLPPWDCLGGKVVRPYGLLLLT